MKKFVQIGLIPLLILTLGIVLRTTSLAARAPFDWDQNRDYLEVAKIASGKPTLIGPVAKGEGGFFLGPLYYYLLTPLYLLTQGNPLSLPLTSVILDALALAFMLGLGIVLKKPAFGYLFALLWAVSPSAVDASRISWNVALLPAWFIAFVYYLNRPRTRNLDLLVIGILAGLSWHIHAALIPLAPLLLLTQFRTLALFSPRLIFLVLGYLLPLSPLILFDLRHVGLQSNLIRQLVINQESVSYPLSSVLYSTLARYGKNLATFFGGNSDLNLTLGVLGVLGSLVSLLAPTRLTRLTALAILSNLLLVLLLGEVGFPEYYLATATLGTCLILAYILASHKVGIFLTLLLASFLFSRLSFAPTPYSLGHKQALVDTLARNTSSATLIYDLPFGRESGFPILLKRAGIRLGDNSHTLFQISEKTDPSLYINGELASDLGYFGAYRLLTREVK